MHTSQQHIQVMRIKELIAEYELSWCLNKFSQLVLNKILETSKENLYNDAGI